MITKTFHHIELIKEILLNVGINLYSILVIVITITGELLSSLPSWLAILLTILLVASVIFMNVARGIAYIKGRKEKRKSKNQD